MLDSLQTAEDLAGLRLAYLERGPAGSGGPALTEAETGAAERRVEDAAFGLRWLEITHGRRFELKKPLAHELPLEWLCERARSRVEEAGIAAETASHVLRGCRRY